MPKCFKAWSHVIYKECVENLYSVFSDILNKRSIYTNCISFSLSNWALKLKEVINFNNFFQQFFVLLHLLMIFNKQNFLIKTIYSPFNSVDIFINVNLLYFCITQGMSKLIIQIFINTEFFDHVSMVNGNSKLKYCLLVQEEKKTANETNDSTWFNYERLFDVLGEGFSETFFGSGILPFQS